MEPWLTIVRVSMCVYVGTGALCWFVHYAHKHHILCTYTTHCAQTSHTMRIRITLCAYISHYAHTQHIMRIYNTLCTHIAYYAHTQHIIRIYNTICTHTPHTMPTHHLCVSLSLLPLLPLSRQWSPLFPRARPLSPSLP
jgi:hypothetical protein